MIVYRVPCTVYRRTLFLVSWILFTVHGSPFTWREAWAATVNRILVVVNEDIITEADVTSHVTALLEDQHGPAPDEASSSEMHQAILHRLIEQRLMLQEARRSGTTISSDDVLRRLGEVRKRFVSEEEFQHSLAESGLSEEQLKEQIRDQLTIQAIIDAKVRSTINVSPQEVAQELERHPELAKPGDRVRASHILIRVNESRSEEQARALIADLHRQLTSGAPFSALAKRDSEDPHAEDGGQMGWVAQGELLPELDAALFRLKPGELSAPIQTRLGFHLVKVEERRTATDLSITEANRSIYQRLYQQKFEQAFDRWLNELKRRAYIEIVKES